MGKKGMILTVTLLIGIVGILVLVMPSGSKTNGPGAFMGPEVAFSKPTINLYLENSGSMFGYIRPGNDFDRSISSLLTNIVTAGFSDSIKLYYINRKIFPQNVDITTFIRNTNMHNAGTKTETGTTDMCNLFDMVTDTVDDSTVSVFVSDCIFSPGNSQDASKYLGSEMDCITRMINQKLKNKDLAFIVYRLISDFTGNYFDCKDSPTWLPTRPRPYFIWVIGNKTNIAHFRKKISVERIDWQLHHSFTMFSSPRDLSYAVQIGPKKGNFRRRSPVRITNAKRDGHSGEFLFSIAVDFSKMPLNDDYLTNSSNYYVSNPNYSLEIIRRNLGKHTHLIKVSTKSKIISPTGITIKLLNKIPDWVERYSDDTCANINQPGMMEKTYGIKQIVRGIFAAYHNDVLAEIKVSINQ